MQSCLLTSRATRAQPGERKCRCSGKLARVGCCRVANEKSATCHLLQSETTQQLIFSSPIRVNLQPFTLTPLASNDPHFASHLSHRDPAPLLNHYTILKAENHRREEEKQIWPRRSLLKNQQINHPSMWVRANRQKRVIRWNPSRRMGRERAFGCCCMIKCMM